MEEATQEGSRDFGPQPLDDILREFGLENRDLVVASTEQLTHKQVQRGRKGRRLTRNMQKKIRNALQSALGEKGEDREIVVETLFNYRP